MKASKVFKFTGIGLFWLVLIILVLFITMNLWNWLVPALFHGPIITFWQTAGLIVLSKIFLSGFSGGGGRRHHGRGLSNLRNGEHPSREEWWKRFNEMNKGKDNSSNVE